MQALSHRIYRFNEFELDALKRPLLRRGQPVTLQSKAFDLLLTLVENGGRRLTKDDLLNLVVLHQHSRRRGQHRVVANSTVRPAAVDQF